MGDIPLMVEERQCDSDYDDEDRLQIHEDYEDYEEDAEEEEDGELQALQRKSHMQTVAHCDEEELLCWTRRHFETWGGQEVASWLTHFAVASPSVDLRELHLEKFHRITGPELRALSAAQLCIMEPRYGKIIHTAFQELMHNSEFKSPDEVSDVEEEEHDSCFESDYHERTDASPIDYSMRSSVPSPSLPSLSAPSAPAPTAPAAPAPTPSAPLPPVPALIPLFEHIEAGPEPVRMARRGRPPKHRDPNDPRHKLNKKNNASRELLWKFVVELLASPAYNPSHICWERKEDGIFRFVQSEKCAQMWGKRKNNAKMTYEKMSRAMRYCRSSEFFADVPKDQNFPKKLCFKFGPKATAWKKLL